MTEELAPLTNGHIGDEEQAQRGANGRFLPGNKGGPGNPHAKRVAEWRGALVETITKEDIVDIVMVLVKYAKAGESWAVKEVLDRCYGKPQIDLTVRETGELKTYIFHNITEAEITGDVDTRRQFKDGADIDAEAIETEALDERDFGPVGTMPPETAPIPATTPALTGAAAIQARVNAAELARQKRISGGLSVQ